MRKKKSPKPVWRDVLRRVTIREYKCHFCGRWFVAKRAALYCPQSSGRFCRNKAHLERH